MAEAKEKIDVLHILEATTGGTRRHLVDLTTTLDKSRFNVSVLCSTERDKAFLPDIDKMRDSGVEVVVVPMVRSIRPNRDAAAFRRIQDLLKHRRFDIVHTHSSKAGFLGRTAARSTHIPVIIHSAHVFAFQMDISPAIRSFYLALERIVARWTNKFICVCADEKKTAVNAGLAHADRFTVIHNGIRNSGHTAEPPDLGFGSDNIVIGTIGRLTRQKGQLDLVRAAKSVIDLAPHARFIIAGRGELKTRLQSLINSLSLEGKVQIVDNLKDFTTIYPAIDIFAMPSAWEGLPYALLDAMSHGNAIAATRVGGVPEALNDGESGLLVPPADPAALALAIVRLINEPELRARLGSNAKLTATENFSLEQMVKQTETLYHNTLT